MNTSHPLFATFKQLESLASEMATARRWDDVKAIQTAQMQIAAQIDADRVHPIMGQSDEADSAAWSMLVD